MPNRIPDNCGWYMDEFDLERFWQHVDFSHDVRHAADPLATAEGSCWNWESQRANPVYGRFRIFGNWQQAHRVAYKDAGHKLDESLSLDHLCRNHACVNPDHLEPVTHIENVERGILGHKTHCKRGHEFTPENTRLETRGSRQIRICKTCRKDYAANLYQRRKANAA